VTLANGAADRGPLSAASSAAPSAADGRPGEELGEASYDRIVSRLIPGYASLARLGVALLAASPLAGAPGAEVLVAGCGSGAELLEARAQRPDWQLTGLDPSAAMLALARTRLGGDGGIDWHHGTVEDLAAQARFDGALAVLVLQSLPDDGSKLAFLTALARSLRPGGQVVLVDLMQAERSPLQNQLRDARLGFQRASGLADPSGVGPSGSGGAPTGPADQSLPAQTVTAQTVTAQTVTAQTVTALTVGLHPIGLSRLTALVAAAGFGDPAPVFQALDVEGFLLQRRG
jgi:tRNA (cmo5U34)-methyltransferase